MEYKHFKESWNMRIQIMARLRGHINQHIRGRALKLFVVLNIVSGFISEKTAKRKTRLDFFEFMDSIVDSYNDTDIHVIIDNYGMHKGWMNGLANIKMYQHQKAG